MCSGFGWVTECIHVCCLLSVYVCVRDSKSETDLICVYQSLLWNCVCVSEITVRLCVCVCKSLLWDCVCVSEITVRLLCSERECLCEWVKMLILVCVCVCVRTCAWMIPADLCVCVCVCPSVPTGCADLHLLDMLTPMERKRQGYIHELIVTEENYVNDLQLVTEVTVTHTHTLKNIWMWVLYTLIHTYTCSMLSAVDTDAHRSRIEWDQASWSSSWCSRGFVTFLFNCLWGFLETDWGTVKRKL